MMTISNTLYASGFLLCAGGVAAFGADPPLKSIYADDATLKAAHLVYSEIGEQHLPVNVINKDHHSIQYQVSHWRAKVDTSSTPDGCFTVKTLTNYPGQPLQEAVQIYNGVDKISVFHGGKEVQFTAYVPQDVTTDRAINIAPGPCFAIGRGLSLLNKPYLSGSSASPVLTGTYSGDVYRANLDPQHGYLATQIVRLNSGTIVSRWKTGRPFHIPGGAWIATHSTYDTVVPSGDGDHYSFSVLPSANWKSSLTSSNYEWQVPGKEIVDLRLGKPAVFDSLTLITHSNGVPLTSASLLEFTRKSLAFQAKRELENEGLARQHNMDQAVRPTIIKIIMGILIITMALLIYRRRGQYIKKG